MGTQTTTFDVDVPEGWELSGDVVSYLPVPPEGCVPGAACICARVGIRKAPDPVQEWLAAHPWLPEGCWVWRNNQDWWVSHTEPKPMLHQAGGFSGADERDAMLYGHDSDRWENVASFLGFTPPPCDLVHVKREPDAT